MKSINIFRSFIGIGIFLLFFSLSSIKVDAAICSACKDGGPTPTLPTCTATVTTNCVEHQLGDPQDGNPWCPNDTWMGYSIGTVKMCCTPYYTYECGTTPTPTPTPTPCTCSCPSVLTNTSNNWYVLNSPCTSGTGCSPFGCYEVTSPKPVPSLTRHPETKYTTLGFKSENHTGGGQYTVEKDDSVNDFLPYSAGRYINDSDTFYMEAKFVDTDQKIEAVYVWFTQDPEEPVTPKKIDLDNSVTPNQYGTASKKDFGFMLNLRDGAWTPYIPAIYDDNDGGTDGLVGNDSTDWWKKATNIFQTEKEGKTIFSLPGKDGQIAANVIIYSIKSENDGKTITLKFGLSFKDFNNPSNLLTYHAKEGKYNIWLMGNDKFGFTPYDNYTTPANVVTAIHNIWKNNEKIRFYDKWVDSGLNWNVNLDKPGIKDFKVEPQAGTTVRVNWDFIPDTALADEFHSLVLNVYKSKELIIDTIEGGDISNYGSAEVRVPFTISSIEDSKDIIGHLDSSLNNYLLKLTSSVNTSGDGGITINLGDVGSGFLYFYLTAFDKGGNVAFSGSVLLDLRDWMVTQGGLLYSKEITFNAKDVVWDSKTLLNNVSSSNADLSTELVGIEMGALSAPLKSSATNGYMIFPYTVTDLPQGYYSTLRGLFDGKKSNISNLKQIPNTVSLSGSLSSTYGVTEGLIGYLYSSDLTVSNGFNCNGKAAIFVSGNLTIQGKILNGNINSHACIFVVGGEVFIKGSASTSGSVQYDEVNAYILADGKVTIEKEQGSVIPDGLYVSGGIHSLDESGVMVYRRLNLVDRLKYPVLVVNHHSKYGALARTLFGGSLIFQKTEVGIKPY